MNMGVFPTSILYAPDIKSKSETESLSINIEINTQPVGCKVSSHLA